jgi:voltage-dependent calcium channel L type alpha-1D
MNFGITTFDNIGVSMLTIFQSITLEGWSDLMYMMMDSGSPAIAAIFFILLVFFGAFFLLNVILVVIISNYSDTKNASKETDQF